MKKQFLKQKNRKIAARPAGCKAAKAVWHKNIRIVRFDQTVRDLPAFHQTKCEFELFSCIGKVSQVPSGSGNKFRILQIGGVFLSMISAITQPETPPRPLLQFEHQAELEL